MEIDTVLMNFMVSSLSTAKIHHEVANALLIFLESTIEGRLERGKAGHGENFCKIKLIESFARSKFLLKYFTRN